MAPQKHRNLIDTICVMARRPQRWWLKTLLPRAAFVDLLLHTHFTRRVYVHDLTDRQRVHPAKGLFEASTQGVYLYMLG